MLVFPQLVTGAATLYPVKNTYSARTVVNSYMDGNVSVWADPNGAQAEWELDLRGLTFAEWNAIDQLLQACGGMYLPFTLLDPTGNLLAESEGFNTSSWTPGALVQITAGLADPFGGTGAVQAVNASQAIATISQALAAPGNFQYCLSVWACTTAASTVTLSIGSASQTFSLGAQWQRICMTANAGQATNSITFAIGLQPGASVQLFGAQAEAQLVPSDYKKTGGTGGVYTARFASDDLTVTALGTDVYNATIRIVSVKG